MNKHKKFVLFDFDGVIVDSFHICVGLIRRLNPDVSEEFYRSLFHGNVYDAMNNHKQLRWLPDEVYYAEYTKELLQQTPVEGMKELVQTLAKNYILAIISSSPTVPIQDYLGVHGIIDYFSDILGADVEQSKRKKIEMILKKYSAMPKNCIFITDTLGDLLEAKEADVAALAVTWGFHEVEVLKKGSPFAVVKAPAEILERVNGYFDDNV